MASRRQTRSQARSAVALEQAVAPTNPERVEETGVKEIISGEVAGESEVDVALLALDDVMKESSEPAPEWMEEEDEEEGVTFVIPDSEMKSMRETLQMEPPKPTELPESEPGEQNQEERLEQVRRALEKKKAKETAEPATNEEIKQTQITTFEARVAAVGDLPEDEPEDDDDGSDDEELRAREMEIKKRFEQRRKRLELAQKSADELLKRKKAADVRIKRANERRQKRIEKLKRQEQMIIEMERQEQDILKNMRGLKQETRAIELDARAAEAPLDGAALRRDLDEFRTETRKRFQKPRTREEKEAELDEMEEAALQRGDI